MTFLNLLYVFAILSSANVFIEEGVSEVVGFASLELSVCGLRNMHSVDFECGV